RAPRPRASPAIPTNVPLPSSGLSGVELRTTRRRTAGSAPVKLRRSLLEEGASSLAVVLAVERLQAEGSQPLTVLLRHAGEDGLHLSLGPANGERSVGGDRPQVLVRVSLELARRQQPLDQADPERLVGLESPRRVEDVFRVGRPDQIHELMYGVES